MKAEDKHPDHQAEYRISSPGAARQLVETLLAAKSPSANGRFLHAPTLTWPSVEAQAPSPTDILVSATRMLLSPSLRSGEQPSAHATRSRIERRLGTIGTFLRAAESDLKRRNELLTRSWPHSVPVSRLSNERARLKSDEELCAAASTIYHRYWKTLTDSLHEKLLALPLSERTSRLPQNHRWHAVLEYILTHFRGRSIRASGSEAVPFPRTLLFFDFSKQQQRDTQISTISHKYNINAACFDMNLLSPMETDDLIGSVDFLRSCTPFVTTDVVISIDVTEKNGRDAAVFAQKISRLGSFESRYSYLLQKILEKRDSQAGALRQLPVTVTPDFQMIRHYYINALYSASSQVEEGVPAPRSEGRSFTPPGTTLSNRLGSIRLEATRAFLALYVRSISGAESVANFEYETAASGDIYVIDRQSDWTLQAAYFRGHDKIHYKDNVPFELFGDELERIVSSRLG